MGEALLTALGLSEAQLRHIEHIQRGEIISVLNDSQKAKLAALQDSVREAREAEASGLVESQWRVPRDDDSYDHTMKALELSSAQLSQTQTTACNICRSYERSFHTHKRPTNEAPGSSAERARGEWCRDAGIVALSRGAEWRRVPLLLNGFSLSMA
jgi:hypothetical protein